MCDSSRTGCSRCASRHVQPRRQQNDGALNDLHPEEGQVQQMRLLSSSAKKSTPKTVHMILPLPPERLVPPITVAPTTSSSKGSPNVGRPWPGAAV